MTITVDIQNPVTSDAATQSVELPAEIFDLDANVALIHQVVVAQLAAARQGTHATKTRDQVRGGGKKPYRQKGTGRARQGSTRAPQFVGGGVVHGPQPRDYEQRTPKKMKAAALRQALSDRARNGRVHVVTSLVEGTLPSTKAAAASISAVSDAKHVLVVAARNDAQSWKSLRNVDTVHVLEPGQLNTYDVLVSDDVVFLQEALEVFVQTRGHGATLSVGAASPTAAPPVVAPASVEISQGETPQFEAPQIEAPQVEALQAETPQAETSQAETPQAETPPVTTSTDVMPTAADESEDR